MAVAGGGSAPPYGELEEKLSTLFGGHTLSVSTTTLGHISCIPVICHEKDAILLDRMVHHSIQIAATQARSTASASGERVSVRLMSMLECMFVYRY